MIRAVRYFVRAIGILLPAGCVAFGVVSYFKTYTLSFHIDQTQSCFLSVHRGQLELLRQNRVPTQIFRPFILLGDTQSVTDYGQINFTTTEQEPSGRISTSFAELPIDAHKLEHQFLGVGWTSQLHYQLAAIPLWLPAILSGTLTGMLIYYRRQKRSRERIGLCPTCGYDLRATPERCPECGTIPNVSKGAMP